MSRSPRFGASVSGVVSGCLLLVGLAAAGCDDGPAAADMALDPGPDATSVDAAPPDVAAADRDGPPPDRDAAWDMAPDGQPDAIPDPVDAGPPPPDAEPDIARFDLGSPFRDAAPVDPIEPCTRLECACEPGLTEPCYPGPPDTEGVGPCVGGRRTCDADGLGFGPCEGARPPTGEICETAEDEDCDGETPPCSETWVRTFVADLNQTVRGVAVAPGGDVLALVDFGSTINLGAGPVTAGREKTDVGVARFDRHGNPVWSRAWGDASAEFAGQVVAGPAGEVLVVARVYGSLPLAGGRLDSHGGDDIALIMLEPDGRERWSRLIGGAGRDGSERAFIDDAGQVLLTGRFEASMRFGDRVFDSAGETDAFAAVFDGATGELLMARQAGGAGADGGWGIARGDDGAVYVTGRFEGFLSWGGEPIESAGGTDVFVVALEADGSHRWTRRFGGPGEDGVYDLVRDSEDGSLYIFGWFHAGAVFAASDGGEPLANAGSADFYVARVLPDGEVRAVAFGDEVDQIESPLTTSSYGAMALGPDGVYIGGPFAGAAFGLRAIGGMDGFVARLDRDLVLRDALGFGTEFSEVALDVAVDVEDGAVVIGGRFFSLAGPMIGPHGPLRGPQGPMRGDPNSDGFVTRLTEF